MHALENAICDCYFGGFFFFLLILFVRKWQNMKCSLSIKDLCRSHGPWKALRTELFINTSEITYVDGDWFPIEIAASKVVY